VKATAVIVRFLSLLDIALILLGVLMITLMQTQLRDPPPPKNNGIAQQADITFVYLLAGWEGKQNGRCYLLTDRLEFGQEVRTDTADDLHEILAKEKTVAERNNEVVMLFFSDEGWYAAWDVNKLAEIEKIWKIKVIPIYNVQLRR